MVPPIVVGSPRLSLRCRSAQSGFTYLTVLFFVFLLLLSLGAASEHIYTLGKREREAELLFVGEQYRNAIASHYYNSPGGVKILPQALESLILDKRSINAYRHLRKIYRDPITGGSEWGLVKTPQGEITGVYSLSDESILTTVNNSTLLQSSLLTENSVSIKPTVYSDWKFIFKPDDNVNATAINSGDALNDSGAQSGSESVAE